MLSKLTNMRVLLAAAIATFGLVPGATGHTWVEQLRNINNKGEYVGNYGYPRGMFAKTDPGFDGNVMNWLLPQPNEKTNPWIGPESMLCHPSQRKQENSKPQYPRLQTAPGQFIAMRYAENGHVTKFNDATNTPKPKKGGTIFIYGTMQPQEDEKLVDVLQWTQDGKGGNKKGKLLATNNFDDERCYEKSEVPLSEQRAKADPNYVLGQVSDGPGNVYLPCESNVALPKDAEPGKPYTFYWVWQWNTEPGRDPKLPGGKDEYYTTCMDVDVVDTAATASDPSALKYAMGPQQDAMSVAVKDFKSRTALYTDAIKAEVGPVFRGGKTASGSPDASVAPSAPQNTPPASQPTQPAAQPPAQSTLATVPKPPPGDAAPTGIPTMTTRPGRPQPKITAAPGKGDGSGKGGEDPVTVTDTVIVTVTATANNSAPTARAAHVDRHRRRQLNFIA